ncbi:MAG: PHB depolymerase family esterase [Thermodesulfobacteriota bacterium]|nr:PHB depolymerase family esterase [Thermodesulfobacteriota bacterium]
MLKNLLALLICFLICSCTPALKPDHLKGGLSYTHHLNIRYNGARRSYLLHVPALWEPSKPSPLVIVLHGAFETARSMEKQTGFSKLADKENFFVLYPNGIGIFGWLQHWNAGHCCGKAASDDVDDVGFIDMAIEETCRIVKVDRRRIYMVGFSNGGMLTHRFGSERSGRLAAIAPLASSIGGRSSPETSLWQIKPPESPLPVIIFHGTNDKAVPYSGGFAKGKVDGREYLSVPVSTEFWKTHNRCLPRAEETSLYQGAIVRSTWRDNQGNIRVQRYTVNNWGHVWPGPYFTGTLQPDHPLHGYDAARVIWDFFEDYRR